MSAKLLFGATALLLFRFLCGMHPRPNSFVHAQDLVDGAVILIDKPLGWTSFDVIKKLRYNLVRATARKRFKVGHAGTLDPLASGLLVICVGKMTKNISDFQGERKMYTGTITLGATTPSFDLEMEIDQKFDISHISPEMVNAQAQKMIGEQLQTPPTYSAKKIDGKRAFDYAREGKPVEMRKTLIEIFDFNVDTSEFPKVHFEIECGKGTYIRSIAHDFGLALGAGAHLSALRRTKNGPQDVADAWTVQHAVEKISDLEPLPKPAG